MPVEVGAQELLNAVWWSTLATRFKGRPPQTGANKLWLPSYIMPVASVDRYLDRPRAVSGITTPTVDGLATIWTVPAGKAWTLFAIHVEASSSGNYSYIPNVQSNSVSGTSSTFPLLTAAAAAAVPTLIFFGSPIEMAPGWRISRTTSLWVAGGTGNRFGILVLERDAVVDGTPFLAVN